jgi:predicted PurR-regulated permease PerM
VPVPAVKRTILAISIMLCLLFTGRVLSLLARSLVVGCYSLAADVDQYKAGIKRIEKWVRAYIRDMHMESFDWNSMLDEAVSFVQVWFSSLTSNVLFSFVQGTVMLIFLLYMLWSPVKMESNTVTREVFKTTGRYLMVKCLISAFTGILIAVLLWCCDLQLPGTFGLFAFLAKFLPGIGSVIAPTLPCILAIVDVRKTPTQVLVAFVLQSFAHFCIDCFVEPMFFGMSMQIHSVIVVLGIWFFFSVWGIAGALLSVPILAVARLLLKSMKDADQGDANDTIAFFDNILEGRWMSSVGDNHQNAEQEMELPEFSILQGDSKDLSQDIQLAKTASQPPIKDFWEILNQTDAGRLLRDFYASNQFCIDLILLIGLMAALVFAP